MNDEQMTQDTQTPQQPQWELIAKLEPTWVGLAMCEIQTCRELASWVIADKKNASAPRPWFLCTAHHADAQQKRIEALEAALREAQAQASLAATFVARYQAGRDDYEQDVALFEFLRAYALLSPSEAK